MTVHSRFNILKATIALSILLCSGALLVKVFKGHATVFRRISCYDNQNM